jgi:hypothetical protein
MRVELRVEARHDLFEAALFYEQQRPRFPLEAIESSAYTASCRGDSLLLSTTRLKNRSSTLSQFSAVDAIQTQLPHDSDEPMCERELQGVSTHSPTRAVSPTAPPTTKAASATNSPCRAKTTTTSESSKPTATWAGLCRFGLRLGG